MKRVIRSRATGKFLKDGEWTDELDEATNFASVLDAMKLCSQRRLRDIEIVLCFEDRKLNISLPIFDR